MNNEDHINNMWNELAEKQKTNKKLIQECRSGSHPFDKLCIYFCGIVDKILYRFFNAILTLVEKIIGRKL